MRRENMVNRIASELRRFAPEADTILYGSEARGEARPDSDIDLLILLPDTFAGLHYVRRRSAISGRLYDLSLDLGVDISPLILPKSVWESRMTPFTVNVRKDGIQL
ncbi:nucleotidyltransferase domain-containing protein [Lepagella muris]|uniref:Nucleotidyltransferase domain-containing protein n=1 Tax=Lepagella muris TaxID=3032870 RepID=A0AC61RB67_9BACT|nr:nucleotidyltransferase domain-containing protein [Lepagella muris]ROT07329.1 nucleotidyltransferase domain-containing protein [Muribaculaceae bacterium Isolate-037 (Harlan)]TGY75982.1 nucleotidyltransferase domain-containing protein [Lepagella muris]THG46573.1 nucleotidyltransferase domain-containing protein [Bacteroidales bacterium]TKC55030.1 nucleotidyltransferase domain-containing protein [Bacteroidales bacterium]